MINLHTHTELLIVMCTAVALLSERYCPLRIVIQRCLRWSHIIVEAITIGVFIVLCFMGILAVRQQVGRGFASLMSADYSFVVEGLILRVLSRRHAVWYTVVKWGKLEQ